jgi:uncharacterized protein YecE (DUF72 family)
MAGAGPKEFLLCPEVQPVWFTPEAPERAARVNAQVPRPGESARGLPRANPGPVAAHWKPDTGRLAGFLQATPSHYRWAIELRDPRWLCDEVYAILRRHAAALCLHDLITNHPRQITADWVYLRFHGTNYGGSYSPQALTVQARQIEQYLADGLDVFAYFNNDAHGGGVANELISDSDGSPICKAIDE